MDVIQNPNSWNNYNFQQNYILNQNDNGIGFPLFFDVWPDPIAKPDTAICQGDTINIGEDSLPGRTYTWAPAATLDDPTSHNPQAFPDTTTIYTVTTTGGGCDDTATVKVTVWDTAYIETNLGTYAWCPNDYLFLTANGGVVEQWYHNGDSIIPGNDNRVLATDTGTYEAVYQSCQTGVIDTLTAYVYWNPAVVTYHPSDTILLCYNDTTQLEVTGGNSYQWRKDGSNIPNAKGDSLQVEKPGFYEVYVEDSCGYQDTGTFTVIRVQDSSYYLSLADSTILCPQQDTLLQVYTDSVIEWQHNQSTLINQKDTFLHITEGGHYTTYFINDYGCRDTATIFIDGIAQELDFMGISEDTICQGDTVAGVSSVFNAYQWQPSNAIACTTCRITEIHPQQPTEVTLTVTDPYGCHHWDTASVTVEEPPTVKAGRDTTICPGQPVLLTTEVTPPEPGTTTYQWSPASGLQNPTSKNTFALPQQTTTYTVTVSQGACTATDSVTIQTKTAGLTAKADPPRICQEDTIQLIASSADNLSGYQWEPNNLVTQPNKDTTTAVISTTTTFTVTATDPATGCEVEDTITVREQAPPQVTISGSTVACQGGSINLTAEGASTYQWQPNNLIGCDTCKTITTTPAQTTTYTVTGTDNYGCSDTATHTVSVISKPDLSISPGDTTLCPGTDLQLNVTGGDTIQWQPAFNLSCTDCRNPTVNLWNATTYTVTTTVAGGCKDTATINIDVHPAAGDPISGYYYDLCLGDTLQLQATGGNTYDWSPKTNITDANTATPEIYPTENTTYVLTMTYGQHGCSIKDSVEVQVNQGQGTLPNDTTICQGQSATLTATGFDSYQWQSSANLPCTGCNEITVSPQQTTDYTLTATSNTGCQVDKTVTVTVASSPNISISGPDSLCAGTKDTLTASGAQNYQWYPTSGIVQSTGEIQPSQTTTYTVEATVNGCQVQSTHTVNVKPLPSLQTSKDTLICLGQSTPLSATGAQSYQWSPDSIVSCTNCPDPIATPTADITYTVTGTANNGCTNTDTVKVDVSPNPIVTVPSDTTICQGDTIQIRALDNNQHEWAPQNEVDCHTCDTVTISPKTRTVFTVTAYGPGSCTASDTVVVDVQKPQVTASNDTTVCPDDKFTLTATGAQTYEWQPTNETGPTIETSTAQAQTFTITGFDNLGCTDTANIQVTVHDTIDPKIAGDTITCPGEQVTWTVTEGQTAYWPDLDTNAPSLTFSTSTLLNYSTIISDANGCTYERTKSLSLYPAPTLTTLPDQTIRQYEELQLTASGASTYEWNPNNWLSDTAIAKPTFQSLETGRFTYTITGYNQFGCKDTAQLIITVELKPEVAIPNAFSPNGDGVNDKFAIQLPEDYELQELRIFNRWGELIFHSTDANAFWNGRVNGQDAPMGTYAYFLKYQDDRGEVMEKQGNVTVVR